MKIPCLSRLFVEAIWWLFSLCIGCTGHFDQPPPYAGTNLQATMSIARLRQSHLPGNMEKMIDDQVITGIVTANDATDNFYKTIVIQDSTAAISIRMDGFGLAADYPLGKRIFVRLNGLWMGEYGSMLQLGGSADFSDPAYPELLAIPAPLFSKVIVVGNTEQVPLPVSVRYNELNNFMQSRLIELDSAELVTSDTARPYADALNKVTVSHRIRCCSGGSVYLRTSGFASFATAKTPGGNGRIRGIFTVFGSQKQLVIRDTSDVTMRGPRCL
ncbi:MAG TPA: DUF5689 domain-containing protein [Sediminibacterium sp.]|nr:DUF5689 domain-containing protein [Sediminibacterium sp.]